MPIETKLRTKIIFMKHPSQPLDSHTTALLRTVEQHSTWQVGGGATA